MLRNTKHDDVPRLAPLEPPYDDDAAALLEAFGAPISLFRLWARRPDRARGIQGWGRYYLSRQSALTLRQRELVIDRTTARLGAEYEWGIHLAVFAEKVGLDPAQVRSLTHGGPDDACWTDSADRAVVRAVDELLDGADVSDATWASLVEAAGEEGALDLLLLCGWYHAISFTARAVRLPAEPGAPAFADV